MADIIIRNFQPEDLQQVARIMADSFRDDLLRLVNLPEDRMVEFLIETGEVYPYPYDGYIVAEKDGRILGLIRLSWLKQDKPKFKKQISGILHYGFRTIFKLLVMRYLFPEKLNRGVCHVSEIAVLKQERKRGIATRLLLFGKELAQTKGLSKYTLHVDARNKAAFNLYRKLGFIIEKRHDNLIARWLFGIKEWYFMSQLIDLPEQKGEGGNGKIINIK